MVRRSGSRRADRIIAGTRSSPRSSRTPRRSGGLPANTRRVRRAVIVGAVALAVCAVVLGVRATFGASTPRREASITVTQERGESPEAFHLRVNTETAEACQTTRSTSPSPSYNDRCFPQRGEPDGVPQLLHVSVTWSPGQEVPECIGREHRRPEQNQRFRGLTVGRRPLGDVVPWNTARPLLAR